MSHIKAPEAQDVEYYKQEMDSWKNGYFQIQAVFDGLWKDFTSLIALRKQYEEMLLIMNNYLWEKEMEGK